MAVFQFVLGVAMILVGAFNVVGRERIVARHRARSAGRPDQPPVVYLMIGVVLVLAGVFQVAIALR